MRKFNIILILLLPLLSFINADDLSDTYFNKGLYYYNIKAYNKAIDYLTQAIDNDPNYIKAYGMRGIIYLKRKMYQEAISDFTKLIETNPNDQGSYFYRGQAYINLEKYNEAIKDATKLVEMDPAKFEGYILRAIAYKSSGNFDEALKDINKAIELNPGDSKILSERTNLYITFEKYHNALKDASDLIASDKSNYLYYSMRGLIYQEIEDYQNALNDFNTAIKLNEDDYTSLRLRGNIYAIFNNKQKAISDINKAIAINPNDFINYNMLADINIRFGNYEEAEKYLKKSIDMTPNSDAYYNLTFIKIKKGLLDEALEYSDKIFSEIKNSSFSSKEKSNAYTIKAQIYFLKNNYNDALSNFQEAFNSDKDNLYTAIFQTIVSYKISESKFEEFINTFKNITGATNTDFWINNIAKFFSGELSSDELIQKAKKYQNYQTKLFEAYFYIGYKSFMEKNNQLAKDYFKKALNMKITYPIEYEFVKKEYEELLK